MGGRLGAASAGRLASQLDPGRIRAAAAAVLASGGGGPRPGPAGVVASIAGPRSYSRYDVEDHVGAALGKILGRACASRRGLPAPGQAAMSWRVSIIDGEAIVGRRRGARPLHRRACRQATVPGAPHPPLAAAMAAISRARHGVPLGPFCGSGTILIESGLQAPLLHRAGLDLHPAAPAAAAGKRPQSASRCHPPAARQRTAADSGRLSRRDARQHCFGRPP